MRDYRGWLGLVGGLVLASAAGGQEYRSDERFLKPGFHSNNWTLNVNVSIRAASDRDANGMPVNDNWAFERAAVVFPLIGGTASSRTAMADITGEVRFNDRTASEKYQLLTGYPGGTQLGKWDLSELRGREMTLTVAIPEMSWETVYDDVEAAKVPWPSGAWPPVAQSALDKPEWYIDFGPDERGMMKPFDKRPVDNLLVKWTNGKDPKRATPAVLAKVLAGELVKFIQVSGNGLNFNQLGQIEGVNLQGVPVTAEKGQGDEFDSVCLLVAVYRRAGLPARAVIGVEAEDPDDEAVFKQKDRNKLRAWAEFALYDEAAKTLTWIPVDIVRQRKQSSRTPPLDKPWKYFGNNDELDSIIPFAFQFHPPTTVRAYGSPAFWGWLVMPEPPGRALQAVWFTSMKTPVRGEDITKQKREEREKNKK